MEFKAATNLVAKIRFVHVVALNSQLLVLTLAAELQDLRKLFTFRFSPSLLF